MVGPPSPLAYVNWHSVAHVQAGGMKLTGGVMGIWLPAASVSGSPSQLHATHVTSKIDKPTPEVHVARRQHMNKFRSHFPNMTMVVSTESKIDKFSHGDCCEEQPRPHRQLREPRVFEELRHECQEGSDEASVHGAVVLAASSSHNTLPLYINKSSPPCSSSCDHAVSMSSWFICDCQYKKMNLRGYSGNVHRYIHSDKCITAQFKRLGMAWSESSTLPPPPSPTHPRTPHGTGIRWHRSDNAKYLLLGHRGGVGGAGVETEIRQATSPEKTKLTVLCDASR